MEWKAFLFSLSVMKGNIFRFFAPAILLGLFLLMLNAIFALLFRTFLWIAIHFGDPIISGFGLLFHIFFIFPIYCLPYVLFCPKLRWNVMLRGFRHLGYKIRISKDESTNEIKKYFGSIFFSRLWHQLGSLALLFVFLPFFSLIFFTQIIGPLLVVVLLFLYTLMILPAIKGFVKHFFSECIVLDCFDSNQIKEYFPTINLTDNLNNKALYQDKKLSSLVNFHPKRLLLWKAVHLLLLLILILWLGYGLTIAQGLPASAYTQELFPIGVAYEETFFLSFSHFLYGFALAPFFYPIINLDFSFLYLIEGINRFTMSNPYAFIVQFLFLLLLGVVTAFFFLVETLSTVYFYHHSKVKLQQSLPI